jgi:hypothetical protein
MARKRLPARDVANFKTETEVWIDHAAIVDNDLDWLAQVEIMTLWNVTVPLGFLARLERLWWVDWRGGSAIDLGILRGATNLRYLCVNQVRNISDLRIVTELSSLELVDLYGLVQVTSLPSFAPLKKLLRVQIGQMRGLDTISAILDAPNLLELLAIRNINITPADIDAIRQHPTLAAFDWFAEDVPIKRWEPVLEAISLPKTRILHPYQWFEEQWGDVTQECSKL